MLNNPVPCWYCSGEGEKVPADSITPPAFQWTDRIVCINCLGTGKLCNLCGERDCDCPPFATDTKPRTGKS